MLSADYILDGNSTTTLVTPYNRHIIGLNCVAPDCSFLL